MDIHTFAKYFDHTRLNIDATEGDIRTLCKQALENSFYSVCVRPEYVKLAKKSLSGTDIKVCVVVGFPKTKPCPCTKIGDVPVDEKISETKKAVLDGADEIDMVINISKLNDDFYLEKEIRSVVESAKGRIVKVIYETGCLKQGELARVCQIAEKAGAHFNKTCSGYGPRGAELKDLEVMKKSNSLRNKVSGGIRTLDKAVLFIKNGVDRIGCSSSHLIIEQAVKNPDLLVGI